MNKLFLYAARNSRKYLQIRDRLTHLLPNQHIVELTPGTGFSSQSEMSELRSGNLIVLYATTQGELAQLTEDPFDFIGYSTILITEASIADPYRIGWKLHPRFVTFSDTEFDDLKQVITNIQKKSEKQTSKSQLTDN